MEKTIGKYKVLREIGKGGMGIVYKAVDPQNQEQVAVKVLPPNMVDRSTVERFQREAAAMAKLTHPNLTHVRGYGMTGGEHYLVMEYLEGDTLKALLSRSGKLPLGEAVSILKQTTEALMFIHNQGMIHRDIKPGNIMILPNGIVKLMDLGLVQIPGATRVTMSGSAVGTAEYMSPEQASGEDVDTRSDIYSLGITAYEMLAGKPPFTGDSAQAVLMKHKYENAPPLRSLNQDVSLELETMIIKAMTKDIGQRYQRIRDLYQDLLQLGEQESRPRAVTEVRAPAPEQVRSASPPPQEAAPVRKKHAPVFVALVILTLVGTGAYLKRDVLAGWSAGVLEKIHPGSSNSGVLSSQTENYYQRLQSAENHYQQAQALEAAGYPEEAVKEYQRAIDLRGDYGLYYQGLALAYEKTGEQREALSAWKALLSRDPDSEYAAAARERLGP